MHTTSAAWLKSQQPARSGVYTTGKEGDGTELEPAWQGTDRERSEVVFNSLKAVGTALALRGEGRLEMAF